MTQAELKWFLLMSNMFSPIHIILINVQVMVMGGLGEEHSVMKLVLGQNNWYSVPPMSFPRVQVTRNTRKARDYVGKFPKHGADPNPLHCFLCFLQIRGRSGIFLTQS